MRRMLAEIPRQPCRKWRLGETPDTQERAKRGRYTRAVRADLRKASGLRKQRGDLSYKSWLRANASRGQKEAER